MTVLGNVAATTASMGSLDFSIVPSPCNSGIAVPPKSKVDRATRNKAGGSNVGGSRTSPKKKATKPPQNTTLAKEVRHDDSSAHPMMKTRSATSKKFLVVFEVDHVLCQILENEQRDLGSLACENFEKVEGVVVAIRWSSMRLIKDCMSKFMVGFYSSLPVDILAGIVNILLRDIPERPLFTWSRADCVETKIPHPENPELMLVMKDLEKVYKKVKGPMAFTRNNTILLDSNVLETVYIPASNVVHPKKWGNSDFEKSYLKKTVWGYLMGLDRYDDVATYTGAHELEGEPRMSSSHVYWRDVAPFSYSS